MFLKFSTKTNGESGEEGEIKIKMREAKRRRQSQPKGLRTGLAEHEETRLSVLRHDLAHPLALELDGHLAQPRPKLGDGHVR